MAALARCASAAGALALSPCAALRMAHSAGAAPGARGALRGVASAAAADAAATTAIPAGRSRVASRVTGAAQFRRMKVRLWLVAGGILVFGYAGRAALLQNMHSTHQTITRLQDARIREGLEASLARTAVRWDVVAVAVELEEARLAALEGGGSGPAVGVAPATAAAAGGGTSV